MQIPIVLGVTAATAVIAGALVVGDSVRISLRELALDRLGKIDYVLIAPRFFDETTVVNWKSIKSPSSDHLSGNRIDRMEGVILFPRSTVEKKSTEPSDTDKALPPNAFSTIQIAGGVMCLGIEKSFWTLGSLDVVPDIADDEAIINMALAEELNIVVGNLLSVRLPALQALPADSPLGKRDESTISIPNLRVIAILPNRSLARFDLRSNQRPARNIFITKASIQAVLERPGQINAALLSAERLSVDRRDSSPSHSKSHVESASQTADRLLNAIPVSLGDLGYSVKRVTRSFPDESIGETAFEIPPLAIIDYLQITSDQLLIPPDALIAIEEMVPQRDSTTQRPQRAGVLAYLANALTKVNPNATSGSEDAAATVVSYSTIAGIEPSALDAPSIGFNSAGSPDDLKRWAEGLIKGEVLITNWLAKETGCQVGDAIRIDYYKPETMDGIEVEESVVMNVAGIVPITEPSSEYRRNRPARFSTAPTPFNDPEMVPKVPGITDQESMNDWDVPFALTRKIRPEDDEYWSRYRLTPKLYMSLQESQRIFGSRFGEVSSVRVANDNTTVPDLESKLLTGLRSKIMDLGWQVIPSRAQQIAASKGTTPFDALFLALSMFVIVSALLLVSLLFRLSIERRITEWGLLKSIGFSPARVHRILRMEGFIVAVTGASLGVGMGVVYGYTVIELLRSWWIGAVGAPFLSFHVQLQSLVVGGLVGVAMAWLTVVASSGFINRQSPISMLKGLQTPSQGASEGSSKSFFPWFNEWAQWGSRVYWILPLAVLVIGLGQTGPSAAGAFVGAGMLMLLGLVVWSYRTLLRGPSVGELASKRLTLRQLAANSARRNPWRSVLAIGLMGIASFLVLSISLFEASPDAAGTGGFDLMAQSTVAIPKSLADKVYQRETLGDRSESLANATIIPMRVRDGDDAGCSNLYQAAQPQVFGLSPRLRKLHDAKDSSSTELRSTGEATVIPDFAWASKGAVADGASPWLQLEAPGDGSIDSPVPVILDQNTALWALHLVGTPGEEFHYEMGNQTVYFKTVAVLQNTILQGSLLIGESNFQAIFPEISGYRAWLVRDESKAQTRASRGGNARHDRSVEEIASTLESGWSDEGMDAASTSSILRNLLAVQNTYLKAFQSLGGLGLLLGTFGLSVVQMRSVQERQPELGLMKAIGFSEWRLGMLLLLESVTLLAWGIGIGVIASVFAILPTLIQGSIPVGIVSPAITMLIIMFLGLLSASIAIRAGVKVPMLKALRSE